METIQTDTVGVELTLGQHLTTPYLPANRVQHTSFLPLAVSASVLVDADSRRIVWTSQLRALSFDFRCCGGKVKDAVKAYEKKYGTRGNLVVLQIENGVVTSHCWTTQKATYAWDWTTKKQTVFKGGRKYDPAGALR